MSAVREEARPRQYRVRAPFVTFRVPATGDTTAGAGAAVNPWRIGGACHGKPDRFGRFVMLVVLFVLVAAFWRLLDNGALVHVLREIGSMSVFGPGGVGADSGPETGPPEAQVPGMCPAHGESGPFPRQKPQRETTPATQLVR